MSDRTAPHVELLLVPIEQKATLANLLELYAHDFSEFHSIELGADGRFHYPHLEAYWRDPERFPFLATVDQQLAGFVLVQRGSQISGDKSVWDIAEFFVMQSYRRRGIGAVMAHNVWTRFPGQWEVRVMRANQAAVSFWQAAIERFVGKPVHPVGVERGVVVWNVFSFVSLPSI
jgi:predicted acetyltransferase